LLQLRCTAKRNEKCTGWLLVGLTEWEITCPVETDLGWLVDIDLVLAVLVLDVQSAISVGCLHPETLPRRPCFRYATDTPK
jgi:hypothetical protein